MLRLVLNQSQLYNLRFMKDRDMEAEANIFAVCLLVPKDLLLAEIDKMGGVDLSEDRDIIHLCKLFQVSISTMTLRFQLLGLYNVDKHNRL